jgi:predicted phosphodiesterase
MGKKPQEKDERQMGLWESADDQADWFGEAPASPAPQAAAAPAAGNQPAAARATAPGPVAAAGQGELDFAASSIGGSQTSAAASVAPGVEKGAQDVAEKIEKSEPKGESGEAAAMGESQNAPSAPAQPAKPKSGSFAPRGARMAASEAQEAAGFGEEPGAATPAAAGDWAERPSKASWAPKPISDEAFARMGISPFDPFALKIRREFDSILFVGDPHMMSAARAPNRRLDSEQFSEVVAGKLEQAGLIARRRRARMAILGDFFDAADDNDLRMLTLSARALSAAGERPMTLVGNHEKLHERVTDNTALGLLRAAGACETLEGSAFFELFEIDGRLVGLGGTGHGNPIPKDLRELKDALGLDMLLWMTHHDLAFGGAYPGAMPIEEIAGVDLMVNGHMHLFKKPEKRGGMVAWNPGNITRVAIDAADHEPAVWLWKPSRPQELEKIPLEHRKDVFNMAGKMEPAAKIDEAKAAAELIVEQSLFAEMLREQAGGGDQERTNDASELWEDMSELFEARGSKARVQTAVIELLRESLGGFLPSTARSAAEEIARQAESEALFELPPLERHDPSV